MFDPTAFDNIKVVLEGALYDLDLQGTIFITDRNDLINTAKMSRCFELLFELSESTVRQCSGKIIMDSQLGNLAAELLPGFQSEKLAGCKLNLQFFIGDARSIKDFHVVENIIQEIWGTNRTITQILQYNPIDVNDKKIDIVNIEFDRLIYENQVDDLIELIDYMIATLKRLQSI